MQRLGQNPEETEKRIAYIKLTLEEVKKETEGATYLECFRKSNLRRTIISIAPLTIQPLCGIFFVSAYSTYYFQLAGFSTAESFQLTIVTVVLAMVGNICSWFIIERVGRRNLTIYGLAIITVSLFVTGGLAVEGSAGSIKGTVALIIFYAFAYNATIGATAYTLLTEIATARLRAKTASIGLALQNALYVRTAYH